MNHRRSNRVVQRESGNGGWRNLVPADGDLRAVQDYSPPPASTGIWVVVYAITMTFAALTSALIVRKGSSLDWQQLHVAVDPLLQYGCCFWAAALRWR